MQTIADELVEQWINGNRTGAVQAVCAESSPARAALLSALIFSQLGTDQRTVYLRLLMDRIGED